MTEQEIKEARKRCEKATRLSTDIGSYCENGIISYFFYCENTGRKVGRIFSGLNKEQEIADAKFIAAARTDLPRALDEIERLRAALETITIVALPSASAALEGGNHE